MKRFVALVIALTIMIVSTSVVLAKSSAFGDADHNGKVDIIDVTSIQQHLAKLITLDDETLNLIDVDGDGKIAIIDCTTVQQYVAKIIDIFPVEEKMQPETQPPTEEETQPQGNFPNEIELEILRLVNIEREKHGVKPVKFAYDYYECATVRARECASEETFSHTRPDGRAWHTVFEDYKAPSYWGAGENLALYVYSAEHVVQGWMNSPGHRANILRPEYDYMAVAICEIEGYPGYYSAAQLFISSWDKYDPSIW